MNNLDVPRLVKRLRRRAGLTQEQFARTLGVSFATINSWENGKRQPQPYLLARLREMEAKRRKRQDRSKRTRRG